MVSAPGSSHRGDVDWICPLLWTTAVIGFGIGDVVTTVVGLALVGVVEANPLARPVIRELGVFAMISLKVLVFGLAAVAWRWTPHPYSEGIPIGLATLGVTLSVWNVTVVVVALLV